MAVLINHILVDGRLMCQIMNKLIHISDDTRRYDVLLTHCPPYGILDQSHRPNYFNNPTGEEHLGFNGIERSIGN